MPAPWPGSWDDPSPPIQLQPDGRCGAREPRVAWGLAAVEVAMVAKCGPLGRRDLLLVCDRLRTVARRLLAHDRQLTAEAVRAFERNAPRDAVAAGRALHAFVLDWTLKHG